MRLTFDTVNMGNTSTGVQSLTAAVTIGSATGKVALAVDDSADTTGRTAVLRAAVGVGSLTGLAPSAIRYSIAEMAAVSIGAGSGSDTLTVDLTGGEPIPSGSSGLQFSGGPTLAADKNSLILQGGSVAGESYTATGPGAGTIVLDGAKIGFSGLRPINDTVPATNFSVTVPAGAITTNVVNGSTAGQTEINSGDSPAAFEKIDFANKTDVTINAPQGGPGTSPILNVNNPAQATGLAGLTINTGGGNNTVNITATPPQVASMINAGAGHGINTINVTAAGLGLGGSDTFVGGSATVILNVDAGGKFVTVTSGTAADSGTIAFGTAPPPNTPPQSVPPVLSFQNFSAPGGSSSLNADAVNVLNAADLPLIPVAVPIAPVEGVPLNNVVVAEFSDRNAALAGSFSATIAWGDGKTSNGTIQPDPVFAGVFDVLGSHTYSDETLGSPPNTVTVTVADSGSTDVLLIGQVGGASGVTVSVTDNGGSKGTAAAATQAELVSDGSVPGAPHTDPQLVNPWGLAARPDGGFWAAAAGSGDVLAFAADGSPLANGSIPIPPASGHAAPSSPTGIVINGTGAVRPPARADRPAGRDARRHHRRPCGGERSGHDGVGPFRRGGGLHRRRARSERRDK